METTRVFFVLMRTKTCVRSFKQNVEAAVCLFYMHIYGFLLGTGKGVEPRSCRMIFDGIV